MLELVNQENLLKTSSKVAPVIKVAHIFWWRHDNRDDVTAIENNRQVRVNIDATLVAIFRIACAIYLHIPLFNDPITYPCKMLQTKNLWKTPTLTEKSKKQLDNIKNATKNFDYTTITDRLRTIGKYIHLPLVGNNKFVTFQSNVQNMQNNTIEAHNYFSLTCIFPVLSM